MESGAEMRRMTPDLAPQRPPGPRGPSPARLALAAKLCYADELTDEAIARRLGISRRTLARWKHRPEFQAAWQRQAERFRAALAAEWLGARLAERERQAAEWDRQAARDLAALEARLGERLPPATDTRR